jgi:hypothetical protein
MPVKKCQIGEKPGYKWGDSGKCYGYTPGDVQSEKEAKQRATNQGLAATGGKLEGYMKKLWTANAFGAVELRSIGNGESLNEISTPVTEDDEDDDINRKKRKDSIQYSSGEDENKGYSKTPSGRRARREEDRRRKRMMKWHGLNLWNLQDQSQK